MRKINRILLLTFLFIILLSNLAFGEDIRIRIRSPRQENESFSVTSDSQFEFNYYSNGQSTKLFKIPSKKINVRINGFYCSYENYKYYEKKELSTDIGPYSLSLDNSETVDFNEILKRQNDILSKYNLKTYIYSDGKEYKLWIGQFLTQVDARNYKDKIKTDFNLSTSSNDLDLIIYLYDSNNNIIVCIPNDYNFNISNELVEKNYVNIDNKPYRGSVGFFIIEGNKLLSINKLNIEEYLMGVVPSEMPSSWHPEALKVQAVAARTYAISNIQLDGKSPYDVADNQNSQVYSGISGEKASTNLAIKETANKLIYFNNNLITAYYHSTSGGYTENSENVWRNELPYIKGVEDSYSNISPHTDWNIDLTQKQIIEILKENNYDVNSIYNIYEKQVSEFNRVIELSILTDIGEIVLEKEEARKIIGYSTLKSTWYDFNGNNKAKLLTQNGEIETNLGGYAILTSKNTSLIKYNSNNEVITTAGSVFIPSSPTEYNIVGKGYGHGLGMSQYGAKGMAEAGFNYIDILKHYYYGVEIK